MSSGATGAGSIAPVANPFQSTAASAAATQAGSKAGGGGGGGMNAGQYQGNNGTLSQVINGDTPIDSSNISSVLGGMGINYSNGSYSFGNQTLSSDQASAQANSLGDIVSSAGDLVQAYGNWASSTTLGQIVTAAAGLVVPGLSFATQAAEFSAGKGFVYKLVNGLYKSITGKSLNFGNKNSSASGGGGGGGGGTGNQGGGTQSMMGEYTGDTGSSSGSGSLGGNMFSEGYTGTASGDAAMSSGAGAPMAGELGGFNDGSGGTWDGSMSGDYASSGGGGPPQGASGGEEMRDLEE